MFRTNELSIYKPFQDILEDAHSNFFDFLNLKSYPKLDIMEDDKKIVVIAELPGIKKEDITISATDGELKISGEKKNKYESKKKNYRRSEISYGSFEKILLLPDDVDTNNIEASFKDSVLELELPRKISKSTSTKKIKIS